MTTMTKNEIFEEYEQRYWRGSRVEKGAILNVVCGLIKLHRKAAIRKFRARQQRDPRRTDKRGRHLYYTPDVTAALHEVWSVSHCLSGERLQPIFGEYVSLLQRDDLWRHGDEATGKLLAMSLGTIKDRIEKFDRTKLGGGRCLTKPSDLKELIPIRRGPWENPPPGFSEIDTVAHCGNTVEGEFAWTVQSSDISTGWCLLEAQLGRGKKETLESMRAMKSRSPFPWLGLDPDSGSEFINWHVKQWCDRQGIALTRIRPGMKNDHGRIEQKNGNHVRPFAGYIRIDTTERLDRLQALYVRLEIYLNHFQPSMKCVKKERIGARYIRRYDKPQTPYERVLQSDTVDQEAKDRLRLFHYTLNPKLLHDEILKRRQKLFVGAKFYKICDTATADYGNS